MSRRVRAAIIPAAVLVASLALCAGVGWFAGCWHETLSEAWSPDGEHLAYVRYDDCGGAMANAAYSEVAVRGKRDLLGLGGTTVIRARGRSTVRLSWPDARTLRVEYQDRRIVWVDSGAWDGVTIVLAKVPSG